MLIENTMADTEEVSTQVDEGELPPLEDAPLGKYYVTRQEVELEVNFCDKSIIGRTQISICTLADSKLSEVSVDARQCEIDVENITVEQLREAIPIGPPHKALASYNDPYRLMDYPESYRWNASHHDLRRIRMRPLTNLRRTDLPAEARDLSGCTPVDGSLKIKLRQEDRKAKEKEEPAPGVPKRPTLIIRKSTISTLTPDGNSGDGTGFKEYRLTIPFKSTHIRDGLHFVGIEPGDLRYPHVYTKTSVEPGMASCIFPCIDDYGSRCSWRISIKCPRTLGDALAQPLVTQQQRVNHQGDTHSKAVSKKQDTAQLSSSSRTYQLTEEDKLLEMTAVCSGLLTDEIIDPNDDTKKIMTFETERSVSVQKLGFAVGPFEHVDLWAEFRTEEDDEKLGASALKIHGYCLPGRAEEVRNTCAAIAGAADYFTLTFAAYPFDSYKICFVDDLIDDTSPLYSFSFISNRLLYPEDIIDTELEVTRQIVHTLAAQWSGINMIANTRRDLWIVIGIAYYMTDLFMKRLCGNNDYRFRMKEMADRLVDLDMNRPSLHDLGDILHLGDFEVDFMALKAPLVLFILDKRLNKANTQTNLTRILSRMLYKANIRDKEADYIYNSESFRKLCEKMGKYKLESFWKQWVYGAGCPRFNVYQRFNKKRLCVEMTIYQTQDAASKKPRELDRADFLRIIREMNNGAKGGDVQHLFTGPMTIKIHEADGTPYEHIVEIREDAVKAAKFEIPYNTKYKRLKRNRRQRERAAAIANVDNPGEANDDVLLYSLGDVLQSADEVAVWGLQDWDATVEKQMEGDSYEWIRMDADFEWLCEMETNLQPWMYVSQLQQDRDVVAQQDSMLYLKKSRRHPVAATVMIRTVMDRRYFHGIRSLAVSMLPHHAVPNKDGSIRMVAYHQLEMAFKELFCYQDTHTPRPNDFSDKRQYLIQCAIPAAASRIREQHGGVCPKSVRAFILDQLLFNNNNNNSYSDNFYVAKLLESLATALIPASPPERTAAELKDGAAPITNTETLEKVAEREKEERQFLDAALEEIERYRRMDEWANSYHNIWTTTALDCKMRLMKAGVIPTDALDFVQYLQDDTHELVRIKAYEALVELGLFLEIPIFRLFLCVMSTDKSPFVRDRLFKLFSRGIASLAFGHYTSIAMAPQGPAIRDKDGDVEMDLLVVQDTQAEVDARKAEKERSKNLPTALTALKKEIASRFPEQEAVIKRTIWDAINSDTIGKSEKMNLLELCGTMFDEAEEWVIALKYPKRWKCSRATPKQPQKVCQFWN
jgi:transcription initiation factor TFIID subunit 2